MAKFVTPLKARAKFQERMAFAVFLKPLRMFCDGCGKYIPSDMEWCCGYCDSKNRPAKFYSFLNKCKECKRSPKSVRCPHCEIVISLDSHNDKRHPARSIDDLHTDAVAEENYRRRIRELERQKFAIEQEITLARLNAELRQAEALIQAKSEMTEEQKLEESAKQFLTHALAAERIVRQQKKLNAELYKDEPEFLQKSNEGMDWWLEQQAIKRHSRETS